MRFLTFELNKETRIPRALIEAMPESGPADETVDWALNRYTVLCKREHAMKYLASTGAWTREEMISEDLSLLHGRLIWLATLDCKEQKTNYFYMGY